jgi:acetyl-CoA carboxylase biotin carboxyl carrier protein
MPLSHDDVREILRLIDESDVEELHVETEGLLLHVVRRDGDAATAGEAAVETGAAEESAPSETRENAPPTEALEQISAPMLGTFYRAPAPGATPFVDTGTRVEPDTVVCLIEVMKMMNAVPAGVTGTIVEVCAVNAELVEAGDALFRVSADP